MTQLTLQGGCNLGWLSGGSKEAQTLKAQRGLLRIARALLLSPLLQACSNRRAAFTERSEQRQKFGLPLPSEQADTEMEDRYIQSQGAIDVHMVSPLFLS